MTGLLVAALMMAQRAPHRGCDQATAPVQAVRAVAAGIIDADNARDLNRVLAFYTEDAVLMPPNEAPATGPEAIRPRYEALFAGFDPQIEARIDEACVDGQLAFVRGHNGGRLKGRDGHDSRALDDVYVMLLRKDADGVWRISHLVWHSASRR